MLNQCVQRHKNIITNEPASEVWLSDPEKNNQNWTHANISNFQVSELRLIYYHMFNTTIKCYYIKSNYFITADCIGFYTSLRWIFKLKYIILSC